MDTLGDALWTAKAANINFIVRMLYSSSTAVGPRKSFQTSVALKLLKTIRKQQCEQKTIYPFSR